MDDGYLNLPNGYPPKGGAYFNNAKFGHFSAFSNVKFGVNTSFENVYFGLMTNFSSSTFGEGANFRKTKFEEMALFISTSFNNFADFSRSKFKGTVMFNSRIDLKNIRYENGDIENKNINCIFRIIDFSYSVFYGSVEFIDCHFTGPANFSYVEFAIVPEFAGSDGHGYFDVTGMKVGFFGEFANGLWLQPYWTHDTNIATRIRRLRKIMADIHAQDAERDLFILERQAERLPLLLNKPLQGMGAILLLGFYWLLSNYGCSIRRPIFWFCAQLAGFFWLYQKLIPPRDQENFLHDVLSYTSSHALPFVGSLNPTRDKMMARLFGKEEMLVPLNVELLSILQSGLGALLLFLIFQALRNHFKIK
jgi:hypothetical protein